MVRLNFVRSQERFASFNKNRERFLLICQLPTFENKEEGAVKKNHYLYATLSIVDVILLLGTKFYPCLS